MNNATADKEAVPAIRKRPQKLLRPRLSEVTIALESGQTVSEINQVFSIFFILSPSDTFRIALETSPTRGDPLGKACK